MKTRKIILLFMLTAWILPGFLYSRTIIRIGCVAQPGSLWHGALEELGKEWEKITRRKVKIEILPGELMGSEYDMIREMKNGGQLDGAAFFNRGLPRICPETYVFTVPLVINSREEHDYVFNQTKGEFEKKIEAEGFKVITWSLSGWLKLFSKHPVFYPADLQKHKLSLTTWNQDIEQGWRDSGFCVVPTDFKDLKMALESGMVDAFFLSPLAAESGEYFPLAPNMCTRTVAPEYWCIVLREKTWEKIPHQYKNQMLETAQKLSEDLYEKVNKLEEQAVEHMEEQGLMVNKLPADALEKWQTVIARGLNKLVKNNVYPRKSFTRMMKLLNEYRQKHPPPSRPRQSL